MKSMTAEETALYLFLQRKFVTDRSSAKLFNLWFKVEGIKQLKK